MLEWQHQQLFCIGRGSLIHSPWRLKDIHHIHGNYQSFDTTNPISFNVCTISYGAIQSFLLATSSDWDHPQKTAENCSFQGTGFKSMVPWAEKPTSKYRIWHKDPTCSSEVVEPSQNGIEYLCQVDFACSFSATNITISIMVTSIYAFDLTTLSLSLSISCSESYVHCTAHPFSYLIIYYTTCILAPICEMDRS